MLRKYGFVDSLILEETGAGLFLRKQENNKLLWEETYKAMSEEQEDWSDFNVTVADGLEEESYLPSDLIVASDLEKSSGCGAGVGTISEAMRISWTRDPFDRIITAAAMIHQAPLLTKDEMIKQALFLYHLQHNGEGGGCLVHSWGVTGNGRM